MEVLSDTESASLLNFFRNPNLFGNGSWTQTYWPLYSSYNKEYLSLNVKNKTVGHGVRARKCAFWHSYLPSLLSKYCNQLWYKQTFSERRSYERRSERRSQFHERDVSGAHFSNYEREKSAAHGNLR